MQVTVTGHGLLEPLCGGPRVVHLERAEATVGEVLEALAAELPALAALLPRTACACGDQLLRRADLVADGDQLALIPPVSGG